MHNTPRSRTASSPGLQGRAGPELCPIPCSSSGAKGWGETGGAGSGGTVSSQGNRKWEQPCSCHWSVPAWKAVWARPEWGFWSEERKGSEQAGGLQRWVRAELVGREQREEGGTLASSGRASVCWARGSADPGWNRAGLLWGRKEWGWILISEFWRRRCHAHIL